MPIVITRSTGNIEVPPITPAQQESLFSVIVKAYLEKHPEVLDGGNEQ